jgi:hypothetical protein
VDHPYQFRTHVCLTKREQQTMRIFHLATTLVGAIAFAAILPVAVQAAPAYPPTTPQLTENRSTVSDHGHVTIHGTGFEPGELVDITETDQPNAAGAPSSTIVVPAAYELSAARLLAKVRADTAGAFTVTVELDQPGLETILATGETSGDTAEEVERVLRPGAGGTGGGGSGGGNGNGNGSGGGTVGGTGNLPRTGNEALRIAGTAGTLIALGFVLVFLTIVFRRRANNRDARGGVE